MLCPNCQCDNIEGADTCESCGSALIFEVPFNDLDRCISKHTVAEMGTRVPVCVTADSTVKHAIDVMNSGNVGCVLVEDKDELVGIFSERDILKKISGDLSTLNHPVSDYMTASPETITEEDSIAFALQEMDLGGFRHLPTIRHETASPDSTAKCDRTTNIVSVRDILRYITQHMSDV